MSLNPSQPVKSSAATIHQNQKASTTNADTLLAKSAVNPPRTFNPLKDTTAPQSKTAPLALTSNFTLSPKSNRPESATSDPIEALQGKLFRTQLLLWIMALAIGSAGYYSWKEDSTAHASENNLTLESISSNVIGSPEIEQALKKLNDSLKLQTDNATALSSTQVKFQQKLDSELNLRVAQLQGSLHEELQKQLVDLQQRIQEVRTESARINELLLGWEATHGKDGKVSSNELLVPQLPGVEESDEDCNLEVLKSRLDKLEQRLFRPTFPVGNSPSTIDSPSIPSEECADDEKSSCPPGAR